MREILFKAKRIDNGEWVEGYYMFYDNDHIIITINEKGLLYERVRPDTICQYTGLTDKNGCKIWENDVVKDNVIFGNVVWDENNARFMINDIHDGYQEYSDWWNEVEVIGNVFDNPELLGV